MSMSGEMIHATIAQLSQRIEEIEPIYMPLTRQLRRYGQEGLNEDGQFLLDWIGQFLRQEVSAAKFATFWNTFATQAHAERAGAGPRYAVLAASLMRGDLIPFLGAEVGQLARPPGVTMDDLTRKLAAQADYREFAGPLSMISQYYQMIGYSRDILLRHVRETLDPPPPSNPLYALLLAIPQPFIVIVAAYDTHLERLLAERGKRFVVISHLLRSGSAAGKVLLKYSDKPAPEAPMLGEQLSTLRPLEQGYAIIYKICGCFGLLREQFPEQFAAPAFLEQEYARVQANWHLLTDKLDRLEKALINENDPSAKFKLEQQIADLRAQRQPVEQDLQRFEGQRPSPPERPAAAGTPFDSMLIAEEDYFTFARHLKHAIPDYLAGQISPRRLLFLGYHPHEWQDRLILTALLKQDAPRAERAYAVQDQPTPYEAEYWKYLGVELYQLHLKTFVETLTAEVSKKT